MATIMASGCSAREPEKAPRTSVPDKAPQTSFLLISAGTGWRLTVLLNDIPVVWDADSKYQGATVLTPLVRNGDNTLVMRATRIAGDAPPPLQIKVTRGPVAAAARTRVMEFKIEPGESPGVREITRKFSAQMPLKWSWESAEAVKSLSAADREAIVSQIKALADSLAAKNLKGYHAIRGAILPEMAKCLAMETADLAAQEDKQLSKMFAQAHRVEMRKEAKLRFVVSGGCVWVSGLDGEWVVRLPVVDTAKKSRSYFFGPFLFAKIGGSWRLVN